MGIDVHTLNFLRYCRRYGSFGRTVTLGRQALRLPTSAALPNPTEFSVDRYGPYCERLLIDHFGATVVDSIDKSDFEGATIILDLNKTVAPGVQFDTVIDGGCTEHIFDAAQALRNVHALVAVGGQVLHILPANQFCGHGFWQMSPNLFYSLYSQKNGYDQTEIFVASLGDETHWYRVDRPGLASRVEINSKSPLHVMVRSVKLRDAEIEDVQQSDYVAAWEGHSTKSGLHSWIERTKPLLVKANFLARPVRALGHAFRSEIELRKNRLNKNSHLHKVAIRSLLD